MLPLFLFIWFYGYVLKFHNNYKLHKTNLQSCGMLIYKVHPEINVQKGS